LDLFQITVPIVIHLILFFKTIVVITQIDIPYYYKLLFSKIKTKLKSYFVDSNNYINNNNFKQFSSFNNNSYNNNNNLNSFNSFNHYQIQNISFSRQNNLFSSFNIKDDNNFRK